MYLYLTNIEISPLSEYHGPVWPADVWPAEDIQLMEIKYFITQYSLILTWFGPKISFELSFVQVSISKLIYISFDPKCLPNLWYEIKIILETDLISQNEPTVQQN